MEQISPDEVLTKVNDRAYDKFPFYILKSQNAVVVQLKQYFQYDPEVIVSLDFMVPI